MLFLARANPLDSWLLTRAARAGRSQSMQPGSPSRCVLQVAARWHPWQRPGLQAQVREAALDQRRFEIGGDDFEPPAAVGAASRSTSKTRLTTRPADKTPYSRPTPAAAYGRELFNSMTAATRSSMLLVLHSGAGSGTGGRQIRRRAPRRPAAPARPTSAGRRAVRGPSRAGWRHRFRRVPGAASACGCTSRSARPAAARALPSGGT